jgi:hypothetical protein
MCLTSPCQLHTTGIEIMHPCKVGPFTVHEARLGDMLRPQFEEEFDSRTQSMAFRRASGTGPCVPEVYCNAGLIAGALHACKLLSQVTHIWTATSGYLGAARSSTGWTPLAPTREGTESTHCLTCGANAMTLAPRTVGGSAACKGTMLVAPQPGESSPKL